MKITKMHGLGNSQIIVSDLEKNLEKKEGLDYSKIAQGLCHPGFGIGSDQALIILPSQKADFQMRVFNKDGGEAEMCGNGIRCAAKYLFDKNMVDKNLSIETKAGIKNLKIDNSGENMMIEVEMGEGRILEENKTINGFKGSVVSVGNPHFVIFTKDASKKLALEKGPKIENAEEFQPEKTNVEFAHPIDNKKIRTFVWERGAGLTLACGTGACATAFAARKKELVESKIEIELLGGILKIKIDNEDQIKMKGPAEYILSCEISNISKIHSNVEKVL